MTTKPLLPQTSPFLSLPPELRLKIYLPLLIPLTTPITITPLFIRAHYKTLFMSQHLKAIHTPLLRVCRQISEECLPILYSIPIWRASCRLEQLASQIGLWNFNLIRRMEVDADDLGTVLAGLRRERVEEEEVDHGDSDALLNPAIKRPSTFLRFSKLESLNVDGWQKSALTSRGSKSSRIDGRSLCSIAIGVLAVAPNLNVLVQVSDGNGIGGSDARDLSMGRVKWRFLRSVGEMKGNEHVVELVEMIALFDALIEMDEINERGAESESWRGGVFRLYPYLARD